jgi:hypothetical protein
MQTSFHGVSSFGRRVQYILCYLCQNFNRRMLKQCIAFILLLAFMASTFSRAVIVADFYANQDYIAKNLCENRGNPNMHCCGRCILRKRLKKDANQEQNNPERRAGNKETLFVEGDMAKLNPPVLSETTLPYGALIAGAPVDRIATIDHPPA